MSFHHRGLECKSRKSEDTWSNRQVWPWSTKWSRTKANRVLPRKSTGHSKHPLPTTQEMTLPMDITRWLTPKSNLLNSLQPKMEKLYTVSKEKAMAPHSRTLAWKIPWTEEAGRLRSMGSHRVRHDWSNLAAAAAYSQQKQDQELTITQIMNSLLPNSDLNWRK